jgi:biopolymer transport protein ExbD
MNIIKQIVFVAVVGVVFGCAPQEQDRNAVDPVYEHPLVIITKDGQLQLESKPITRDDLAKIVKERAKAMHSKGTSLPPVIVVDPDPEVIYGKVREIQDLIIANGGWPGMRMKAQQTSPGDSSTRGAGLETPEK